jgi:ribosomal peptide maturation radical SAM protein 1
MEKVLLINMPFSSIKWPALGISLLKPMLQQRNIFCDVKYFNLDLATMVGLDLYEDIAIYPQHSIGEWLFAQHVFDNQLPSEDEFRRYLLSQYHNWDGCEAIFRVRRMIGPFLDHCIESTRWQDYAIVGFGSMFEQNLASIALAKQIKQLDPHKTIVFGGANCEGDMGLESLRCFKAIDFVCQGEADFSFPELVECLFAGRPIVDVPGVLYRVDGHSVRGRECETVKDLDCVALPNYSDYFKQIADHGLPFSICSEIQMETSRGCWWGAKRQCRFCGLNAANIKYRSKSKGRVLDELNHLIQTYGTQYDIHLISMVDNVLDMNYFKDVLPELKRQAIGVDLFYEVKANLKQDEVRMLRDAGVKWIQPGIESLSPHVLKLMAKGVTALQNIQLLKHCSRYGVYPTWNIIYGFPGETESDYQEMIDLILRITHLTPPEHVIRLCLQRFSPYFDATEAYGFTDVRPEESYSYIYPYERNVIKNLAYYFEYGYRDEMTPPDCGDQLKDTIRYWTNCYQNSETLSYEAMSSSESVITDTRMCAVRSQTHLEHSQKDVYEFCDKPRTFPDIYSFIRDKYEFQSVRRRDLHDFLGEMVASNFMVQQGSKYMSVAVSVDSQN